MCLVGCVRFARHCGKMYSRHLFSYGGLNIISWPNGTKKWNNSLRGHGSSNNKRKKEKLNQSEVKGKKGRFQTGETRERQLLICLDLTSVSTLTTTVTNYITYFVNWQSMLHCFYYSPTVDTFNPLSPDGNAKFF